MREIPDIPNPFCPFTPESYGISFLGSLNDLWSLRYPGSGIHSPFSSGLILYLLISVTHLCPTLQPHGLQHTRLPCPSPTPGAYSNKYSSHWCCHPTISSSVILPFSPCLQSFLVSGSFPMSQFFESGGQSIGVSDSASVFPMNSGLISFRMDWLDLLAVQGIFKSLLQHHSSKASILQCSAFLMCQLSHDYWKNHSFD